MALFLLLIIMLIPMLLYMCYCKSSHTHHSSCASLFGTHNLPNSYSLIHTLQKKGRLNIMSHMLNASPSSTTILHLPFGGGNLLFTANPDNFHHILKTRFTNYHQGPINSSSSAFLELFGGGVFNVDGDEWRSQSQFVSHSLTKGCVTSIILEVIEPCISNSLIPNLSKVEAVVDLQDVLQRFSFKTTCMLAFGYDPDEGDEFFKSYRQAALMSSKRHKSVLPLSLVWKIERLLNVKSQKELMEAVRKTRASALAIVRQRQHKQKLGIMGAYEEGDFLSRVLQNYGNDENMVLDLIINVILAGADTLPSALTWFFWLLSTNPEVEDEILREIRRVKEYDSLLDQAKNMVYTHAAICETMRLYPPVPEEPRYAVHDDVLPDGTHVTKGMKLVLSIHSMGRSERIWGPDWLQYKPKRWLKWDDTNQRWSFVPRDRYTYSVFSAGPRVCLGIDLAFFQMKILVKRFVSQFKVMPCKNEEPVYVSEITSKMKGGFPVRLEQRN